MVRCALFFCFLTLVLAAVGAPPAQQYRIDSWQVNDGLPQSSITSIVQTHDGYLWLGTFGGLVRFDGIQFKVYNPNNAPGLPSSRILNMFEDQRGTLWIRTEENHLVRHAGGRFELCSPPEWERMPGYVQGFAETEGKLWLITPEKKLIRFAEDQPAPGLADCELLETNVCHLTQTTSGEVWINTDKAIKAWRNGHFETVEELGKSDACIMVGSHEDGCWVAANGRLRKLKYNSPAVDYGDYPWSGVEADCMIEDHLGQVWVGTYGNGAYRYGTNGIARHISTEDGLPGNVIRDIQEDREGNIWLGTESYGLVRLKPAVFGSLGRQEGLSGDCVLSVCEGTEGELWIGLNGSGVDRLKDGKVKHYRSGLTYDYVWSVFQDESKTLWAGTWGSGLFKLNGEDFIPVANPGECGGIICALYGDPDGSLWLGQQRAEQRIIHLKDDRPMVVGLQSQSAVTDVRAITRDREGSLWIGTKGDGLYRIKQGSQTHFGKTEGLNNDMIRSLYADNEGTLWIGTYGGGLNRMQSGKFTAFTTKEGLANDSLGYVTEDRHGNLWCGSLGGVFRVRKEELNQFAGGQIRSVQCFVYTESDGLPSRECTGGCQPSGCQTRDGRIWFPTIRGLAVVDPESVPVNLLPPPIAIEEVDLEGKVRSSILDISDSTTTKNLNPATLKIPAGIQRLEFHYTALSLVAPAKVRFKYKLEGLEDDWVEAGPRRTADYSHLKPGNYRFCVQACNNDGVWNEQGASLALVILPHFWQTWWFLVTCIIAAILLVVAVYEFRIAAERKLTRMKLQIASDLHDEVGSNLGSIALLTELIPKQQSDPIEEIAEVRRLSLETAGSLRDIVWFLDPTSETMDALILRMKDTAATLLPGIAFEFLSTGETDYGIPSLHFRRNVFLMYKEILHNVAKHARASRVEIQVKLDSRLFQLCVKDNGIGIDEQQLHAGNGLKNLRRRSAALGGELEIHSQAGKGTNMTFSAPIT